MKKIYYFYLKPPPPFDPGSKFNHAVYSEKRRSFNLFLCSPTPARILSNLYTYIQILLKCQKIILQNFPGTLSKQFLLHFPSLENFYFLPVSQSTRTELGTRPELSLPEPELVRGFLRQPGLASPIAVGRTGGGPVPRH